MSRRSSVQDAVRLLITRNPYLYRGIRMKVINYSAVARFIHTDVENLAGSRVDPNTIVTAIIVLIPPIVITCLAIISRMRTEKEVVFFLL